MIEEKIIRTGIDKRMQIRKSGNMFICGQLEDEDFYPIFRTCDEERTTAWMNAADKLANHETTVKS